MAPPLTRGDLADGGRIVLPVIAKAALVLSVVAVALSVAAFITRGHGSSGTCGRDPDDGSVVRCTGSDKPSSSYGPCTPLGRDSGVMVWSCKKP